MGSIIKLDAESVGRWDGLLQLYLNRHLLAARFATRASSRAGSRRDAQPAIEDYVARADEQRPAQGLGLALKARTPATLKGNCALFGIEVPFGLPASACYLCGMRQREKDTTRLDAPRRRASLGRVRLSDVAEAAGVSPVTVSRALRRPDLLAGSTRTAVQAAIARLGYFPDLIAGSLASRRTGQIAIVVPSLATPAFMTTIRGATDTLRAAGYQTVLGDNNLSGEDELALITSLLGHRNDGIILADIAQSRAARTLLAESRVPVVETWTLTTRPIDMNVGFNNRAAARAMTRHLIETGRRRVAMVCGPLRQNERGRQRRLGFLDAVRAASLADNLFVELPFPSCLADCGAALADLLARASDIDAVFCSGDTFAAGCLLEAQRRGWPVPARLALAGLGDVELADCLTPRLSTARVPGYHMGALAARMIIERLQSGTVAPRIVDVGFQILRRESTVALPPLLVPNKFLDRQSAV